MGTVKERVEFLIEDKHYTPNGFAKATGIDPSNMQKKLKGAQPFTEKDLYKISTIGVSFDWLKTGNGDMYEQKQPTTQIVHIQGNNSAASVNGDAYANANINQLEQLVDKIVVPKTEYFLMQQENEHLKSENARLFSIIDRILGENTKGNGEIINKIFKGNE